MQHYMVYKIINGKTVLIEDCGRDEDRAASLAFKHDAEYGRFTVGSLG